MKRETFQFLSSTRSGTRHMLALALWMEPLRMADRGVLAEGNKRNTIIQLRWLRKRKILEGCSGRVDTKEGCDGACCFVLPATTKENISDFAGLNERLRTPYIMRECYCISCFWRNNTMFSVSQFWFMVPTGTRKCGERNLINRFDENVMLTWALTDVFLSYSVKLLSCVNSFWKKGAESILSKARLEVNFWLFPWLSLQWTSHRRR